MNDNEEWHEPHNKNKARDQDTMDVLAGMYGGGGGGDSSDDEYISAEAFFGKVSEKEKKQYNKYHKKNSDSNSKSKSKSTTTTKTPTNAWLDDGEGEGKGEGEGEDWRDTTNDDDEGEPSDSENSTNGQFLEGTTRLSNFQRHQEKLKAQTKQMEEELLAEKPWAMTGEVGATSRPTDSLLEAAPEFERAGKIAPTLSVAHNEEVRKRSGGGGGGDSESESAKRLTIYS